MLAFTKGNILKSNTEAVVNTINIVGVMGKGIALAFKHAFPDNFKEYEKACKAEVINIGKMFVTETGLLIPKYIINFPTKKHWRNPSKYEYIEAGLKDLINTIRELNIQSISIPPLGSGNGKLNWEKVKQLMINYLKQLDEIEIYIYEPGYNDQNMIVKSNVNLTVHRAILLYLMNKYLILGYDLNLLVIQKLAYFMQEFGEELKLKFDKGSYGPYSHNLMHLLKHINNNYISFNQNATSPSTEVKLLLNKQKEIEDFYSINTDKLQKETTEKILTLIEGFESSYGLELLGTIHFLVKNTGKRILNEIEAEIGNWTQRKKDIMKPYHIKVAYERLKEMSLI